MTDQQIPTFVRMTDPSGLLTSWPEQEVLGRGELCSKGLTGCCRWPSKCLCHRLELDGRGVGSTSGGSPSVHEQAAAQVLCTSADVVNCAVQAWQRWERQRGAAAAPEGSFRRGPPRSAGGFSQPGR
jgi:hypothetical protein